MLTACPSGQDSISCLVGILPPGPAPTVLKALLAIPAAVAAGQRLTVTVAATVSTRDAPVLAGTRIAVAAGTAIPALSPAPHSSRPAAAPAAASTPPAARATAPQAGAAVPGPGVAAGAVSAVGAPAAALAMLHPPAAAASGLAFPTVSPRAGLTPAAAARPGSLDGSMSAVADRLPLSGRQLELQSGELGLLAIALVITIARVSVRGRTPRGRQQPIRLLRRLPGHRTDGSAPGT